MSTFVLDSPLILQALLGNRFCDKKPLNACKGFLWNSRQDQIGRAFLEYCYSELFNIRRFPGYEIYAASSSHNCKHLIEKAEITEEDIQYAFDQLSALYRYTQKRLKKEVGQKYKLHRKLALFEKEAIERQLRNGNDDLFLPTNILTCYSHSSAYQDGVVLVRDIDIEDVVMVDHMTSYIERVDCEKLVPLRDNEGETWVINKNMFGQLPIRKEWIVYVGEQKELDFEEYEDTYLAELFKTRLTEDDGKSICEARSFPEKPCELKDTLTKLVINRNIKKIRKRNHL